MPRQKKDPAAATAPAPRVNIRAVSSSQWDRLLASAKASHWRTLRVVIQIRAEIHAGKPANLDAANAMLKARGLDDFVATADDVTDPTLRQELARTVADTECLCEFYRRSGKPGIWMPANNIKAGLKENWSALGLRVQIRGSRGALAEGAFVVADLPEWDGPELDWINLGAEPSGIRTMVAHTMSVSGPISAVKRHEYVERPQIAFQIRFSKAASVDEKFDDRNIADMLVHFGEHGLGANRSQGFGKFDLVSVEEIETRPDAVAEAA